MRLRAWLFPAVGTLVAVNIACFTVAFSGRHNNSRSFLGLPLFWRIPRSAEITMQVLLAYRMDRTLAASGGDKGHNGTLDALRIVKKDREKYVNVDLHKAKKRKEGKSLLRAKSLEADGDTHMADDMLRPPRMYTFYHRVQAGADEDTDRTLLHLWKKEWTRAGYEPHVLTLDHAKKHPSFESYQKMLQENTTLHTPLEYNYMCFFRWLAMAVVGGGYMSDNDVLPLQGMYLETGQIASFELPNGGEFTAYDRLVPSLLSGKAEEWDRLAMSILRIAIDQSSGIIPTGDGGKTSDMYALVGLAENKKDGGVRLSPVKAVGSPQDFTEFDEKACLQLSQRPAVHFSHAAISRMAGRDHINERPAIMEKWINRWRSSCFGRLRAKSLEADGDTHMADDMLRPPRMYTFYHRVQAGADEDTDRTLLHLWKKEWTRAGYEPHVLTLNHAKKHPSFESYQRMLQENTTLHTPLEYNYMCFFRWLAMAVVGGGYMSDNDVLPLQGMYLETGQIASFELPNGGEFTAYDRLVPSLLSGKAEEWDRLAMSILRIAIDQSSGIIPTGDGGKTSDMYALVGLAENKKDGGVRLSPVKAVGSPQDFTEFDEKACLQLSQRPAVHFSHAAISRMAGRDHINERPAIMEKWINRWRSSCFVGSVVNSTKDELRASLARRTDVNSSLYMTDSTAAISRVNKLIYIHIPNTGGLTFEHSSLFEDANTYHVVGGHHPIGNLMHNAHEREITDFIKTSHIRHPCSRFASAFYYLKSLKGNKGDQAWARENIGNLTIDQFVVELENNPLLLSEAHFSPFHKWVFFPDGTFGLDKVLCSETWKEGLDTLAQLLRNPIPIDVYSSHQNKKSHEACQDLKQETKQAIEKIYQMDYCVFGYSSQPTSSCPQAELSPKEFTHRYKMCSSPKSPPQVG